MGTENNSNSSTSETEGQEQQGQQQGTASETEKPGSQEQASTTSTTGKPGEPVQLPDDHPLVKKLGIQKAEIASHKSELAEARAQAARTTQLEEELNKRPTTEALETLQTRYDRLEAFLQAAGGPISKALDSRTFTKQLFESDADVAEIVKKWHKDNPSTTSTALGSAGADPAPGKMDPNKLLRAAIGR